MQCQRGGRHRELRVDLERVAVARPGFKERIATAGTRVDLDVCAPCQVFWFDRLESLRLTPAATLRLFQLIGERPRGA